MGSPITLSGFNDIDFNAVLEAVMTQESVPLQNLQTQQKSLESKASTFRTLAAKLATFESAVADLKDDQSMLGRTASSTDDKAVTVNAGSTAAPGIYDVVVQELARAQVTASTTTTPDADTTVVATGGTLTIGGVAVIVDIPVTLKGLADRINATKDIGVTATVVKSGRRRLSSGAHGPCDRYGQPVHHHQRHDGWSGSGLRGERRERERRPGADQQRTGRQQHEHDR